MKKRPRKYYWFRPLPLIALPIAGVWAVIAYGNWRVTAYAGMMWAIFLVVADVG